MLSSEFLLTTLIIVLIPGTGVIFTVSSGLFYGWRASVAAAFGCTVGILPHLLASSLGLSFILHQSALIFQNIKLAGVAYLLYLAWTMWRDKAGVTFTAASAKPNLRQTISKAVVLNLLNPKLTMFFFAFLPLFIPRGSPSPLTEMARLSAVFILITLLVFVLYGLLASAVRSYVATSPNAIIWLRRSFALAFAGLGIKLALTEL